MTGYSGDASEQLDSGELKSVADVISRIKVSTSQGQKADKRSSLKNIRVDPRIEPEIFGKKVFERIAKNHELTP